MRRRLADVTMCDNTTSSHKVFERIETLPEFVLANNILVYNSLPGELSTQAFIEKWSGVKHLYLPRVNGDDLDVLPYDSANLHVGAYGILEPDGDNIVDPAVIDLAVVPGLGFDSRGYRVGHGKGYYDRLLSRMNAVIVGVAFEFQVFDTIIVEPHDRPVNMVITPRSMFTI